MRRQLVAALAVVVATGVGCSSDDDGPGPPTITASPGTGEETPGSETPEPTDDEPGGPRVIGTAAENLRVPWGVGFLPDGTAIVTERDTRRVLAIQDGDVTEIGLIEEAAPVVEAGLLGVAVPPDWVEGGFLYFYVTTTEDNRILRAAFDGRTLGETEVVLDGIPAGEVHDGGRLEFGPDGYLYASTGETGDGGLAQDRDSLGGKILRITPDGDPAPGNPDPDSPVWTWGHRNVQGLAFDDDENLWASEFGSQLFDELNLIEKGNNYGWPEVEGRGTEADFTNPQVVWAVADASPSGLAHLDGRLYLAALRGARLWRIDITTGTAEDPTDFLVGEYGRLRTVVVAPDGNLWVTTSNHDGRGSPADADDRILVVDPG